MSSLPLPVLRYKYEKAADDYLRSLPPEHFMEAIAQATQRKITLESLDLVHARRPEVQVFNELLVQYPLDEDDERIGQVVPDNMVVLWHEPIRAETSYDVPVQPTGPFWVLEYVSKNTRRKDYEISFAKYEQALKVPYYLLFYPDNQDMSLFRLEEGRYISVTENANGRCSIPELKLEMGLLDGWVRYWYRGELMPLPADLLRTLDAIRVELELEKRRADEQAKLASEEKRRADEQAKLASEEKRRADEQAKLMEDERRRANEQTRLAERESQRVEQERQARLALEAELARMREELEGLRRSQTDQP